MRAGAAEQLGVTEPAPQDGQLRSEWLHVPFFSAPIGVIQSGALPPLRHLAVALYVFANWDLPCDRRERGRLVDCRRFFSADEHLLDGAETGDPQYLRSAQRVHFRRSCDGRNPRVLDAILRLGNSLLWQELAGILLHLCSAHVGASVGMDFFCDHGRHRSVGVVILLAYMLRWLGVQVDVYLSNVYDQDRGRWRYCRCVVCNDRVCLEREEIDRVLLRVIDELAALLRNGRPVSKLSRKRARNTIEFHDFAE